MLGGASSGSEEAVGWGLDAGRAAVQDVGVDHRRGDILVTECYFSCLLEPAGVPEVNRGRAGWVRPMAPLDPEDWPQAER